MSEQEANIDLLFRNGLKDYEVLPPPDAWGKIHPAIKLRSRSFIFIRAAAMIAIVMTMGFLAYRWTREVSPAINNNTVLAIETGSPALTSPVIKSTGSVKQKASTFYPSVMPISGNMMEVVIPAEKEQSILPRTASLTRKDLLIPDNGLLQHGPLLADVTYFKQRSLDITAPYNEYFPQVNPLKKIERWSIGAMASPTYYSGFSSGNALAKQLAANEQPLISYSGGVEVSYKLNKRFSIQTGLYYSSLGKEVKGINSFAGFQKFEVTKADHNFEILTSSGSVYATNPDVFIIENGPGERVQTAYTSDVIDPKKSNLQPLSNVLIQNFSYLEMPVVVRYKIIDKKIDFNLTGGVSYGLLVNNSAYARVDGNKYAVGDTKGLNPYTLSSSLGMGMEYNLSNKISLNLEPTFRYYLNPFTGVTGSPNHPYSFGVFSGFSYKF